MIDPTSNNIAFRMAKRFPDSRFGLQVMHRMIQMARLRKPASNLMVDKIQVPRSDGTGTIRVLVVKPKGAEGPMPVVLHIHGGGFAVGVPDQDYGLAARYNDVRPSIFVMPDYRLSLWHPFPTGLHDCYDTLLWMRDNAARIGGRDDQLFVMGESGGGGLTATVCQMAHDRGEVNVACQFPLYGMFDDREENFTKCDPADLTWSWGKNVLAWNMYLKGHGRADDAIPDYAVSSRRADLSGQPPAIGFVGDHDLFLDENVAYFERLGAAGVSTTFKVFEGAYHGAEVNAPTSDVGKRMLSFICDAYAEAVDKYTATQP